MKTIIQSLEREGGHILALLCIMAIALVSMTWTVKPTVEAICHDVAVGAFSAVLALLKGNGHSKSKEPDKNETP